MREKKLITIVMMLYNKAPYLETWAISVANQTYLNKARVIVIDDGSTDGGLNLLKKLAAQYKIPVEIFVHKKNLGLLYTVLEVYGKIDTKYLTFLDGDDYWVSPQKLEKAVKFLEAHEDYTCYFSNYLIEKVDQNNELGFPKEIPNMTFIDKRGLLHVHASTAVFRNFFTPELLNKMKKASKGYKVHVVETDEFRYYMALRFGKLYFENSVDAVYRHSVGVLGSQSLVERYLIVSNGYWQFFNFYAKNFGLDFNSTNMIQEAYIFYCRAIDQFSNLMKSCELVNLNCGKYFRDKFFNYGNTDIKKIINILLEQQNNFKKLDFQIVGNDIKINLQAYAEA